jgi:benzoyl-CoA reductase/2-hydroxyglutaryl-CoA dehydratase subunit BcrC/BadD/HgdB
VGKAWKKAWPTPVVNRLTAAINKLGGKQVTAEKVKKTLEKTNTTTAAAKELAKIFEIEAKIKEIEKEVDFSLD